MTQLVTSYDNTLLLTLGEITQLVVHSHDSAETLDNIVRLIQSRFGTAVCSVYYLEPESGDLVLGATVGLQAEAIGRVRMAASEGLTGLVAEQLGPVMVPDAFAHPRFKYFPEAGEDRYRSFLGVPLIEGGTLQGVLVVQTVEQRTFQANETRLLVSVAAQLAPMVGDARLLHRVSEMAHDPTGEATSPHLCILSLQGQSLSPGVGLGQAYIVDGFDEWRRTIPLRSPDTRRERERLAGAVARAGDELTRLSKHISELVGEDHGAILQAQLMIMQDRTIERDLEASLAGGATAEGALFATLDQYVAAFQRVSTAFFQERVYDIKDVFHRLLWQLRPGSRARGEAAGPADRVVLVAREASVMELFAVDLDQLAGVVVEHGGAQSHAAILARSLGIPMVGQVKDFAELLHPGRRVLVDGGLGLVTLDPPANTVVPLLAVDAPASEAEPAESPAGRPRVEVNINLLYEAGPAVKLGVCGVGLYRSEFLFLARRTLPTEDEQERIYRKLIALLDGRPVCIRTFDLRPDKLASYSNMASTAARPFDWRLVLDSPPLKQLFREQVRAILRASTQGPVRILVPLVTTTELLDFVLETLARTRADLSHEGIDFREQVPVGVMIEVAAAVPLVARWAERVDFFALGTNDLASSALGIDRDDPIAAGQIDPLHPGILHLIHGVLTDARKANRPVSVCGELAGDPLGGLALSALGVDSLSVAVNQYAATRQAVARRQGANLDELRERLLAQDSATGVRRLLAEWSRLNISNEKIVQSTLRAGTIVGK